ncbi:hypothetical protein MLD52_07135 [Puniceicoccaceae bacterium K14]|nr:hypothetical protein [Puniceicoccaceae bacterium K14]
MNRFFSKPTLSNCNRHENSIALLTDAEGYVQISPRNWAHVFEVMKRFDNYYLQTRHTYGKLVVQTPPLSFAWNDKDSEYVSQNSTLSFKPSIDHLIKGKVARCNCCNSPGRVSVFNQYALEVMQICCPNDIEAIDWGKAILECSAKGDSPSPLAEMSTEFPIIPSHAAKIKLSPHFLVNFFTKASQLNTSLVITLETNGIVHEEILEPEVVEWNEDILTVHSNLKTLQLGLRAVRGQYLLDDGPKSQLLIAGPDNFKLLAIKPTESERSIKLFRSIRSPTPK